MDRARSLPPSSEAMVNPWWSDKCKLEAMLQHRRPEDLPVPADEDLEVEADAVQDSTMGSGGSGKGRGTSSLHGLVGGRLFVTPPSHRGSTEGRGLGKQTEGAMPPSGDGSAPSKAETMGPVPPKHRPSRCSEESDGRGLQRALEAEMVTFLRDQNEALTKELEKMKKQLAGSSGAPSTTPSSWGEVSLKRKGFLSDIRLERPVVEVLQLASHRMV